MDTSTIAATGPRVRSLTVATSVAAPPAEVWSAWTTEDGIAAWWGPEACRVELRIGGPFEILFSLEPPEGQRGSETCAFLAYVPGEMVAFTWNAPPHLPLRSSHTWVAVTFGPEPGGTAVKLTHTGFLEGPDWDDYLAYFEEAWPYVLDLLKAHWAE